MTSVNQVYIEELSNKGVIVSINNIKNQKTKMSVLCNKYICGV